MGPLIKRPRIEEATKDEKIKEEATKDEKTKEKDVDRGKKKLSKSRTKEELLEAMARNDEEGDSVNDVESEAGDGVSDVDSEAGDGVSDVDSEAGDVARDPFKIHFEEDLSEQEVEKLEKVFSVPLEYTQTEVRQ